MRESSNKKRFIYVGMGVVLAGGFGLLLYFLLRPSVEVARPPSPPGRVTGRVSPLPTLAPQVTPAAAPPLPLPEQPVEEVPAGTLTQLTDFPVVAPSLNKTENRILFYKKDGGDLFSSDFLAKQQEKISNITVIGLIEALWSPLRDRAALFYLDQETLKGFLHIGTSSVATLPQNIKSFSWSPDGKSLAYLIAQDSRSILVVADLGGRGQRTIADIPLFDASLSWITQDKLALHTAPSGFAEGFVFLFSRASGILQMASGPAFGLDGVWSPDGSHVFVSSTSRGGKNLTSAVLDQGGTVKFRLPVATFAEKCVWASSKELFCAVPRIIPPNIALPDEYLRGEFRSSDTVVRVDAGEQKTEGVFSQRNFDMENLLVTKKGGFLFFVNRADGTLWSLKLK